MKKFFALSLLLAGVMLCAAGESVNLVNNGDFAKTYNKGTKAEFWGMNSKKDTCVFKPGKDGGVLELNAKNKHTALLQEIALKPYSGSKVLEMSFQYQGTVKTIAGTLHAIGADGKELKVKGRNCKGTAAAEFKTVSSKLTIPAGAVKLRIALRVYGAGRVTFKDVKLCEVQAARK